MAEYKLWVQFRVILAEGDATDFEEAIRDDVPGTGAFIHRLLERECIMAFTIHPTHSIHVTNALDRIRQFNREYCGRPQMICVMAGIGQPPEFHLDLLSFSPIDSVDLLKLFKDMANLLMARLKEMEE